MTDVSLAFRFASLFAGRTDVYGAVHGECKREPVTPELWHNHLFGGGSVGVYPLAPSGHVRWGASDIDRGVEMLVLAKNLYRALRALGLVSWIERSKGKGYHAIVFADGWVPARDMRYALLVAHQLAGVPPTEVNPKATELDHGRCPSGAKCKLDSGEPGLVGGADRGRGEFLSHEPPTAGQRMGERQAEGHHFPPVERQGRDPEGQTHSGGGNRNTASSEEDPLRFGARSMGVDGAGVMGLNRPGLRRVPVVGGPPRGGGTQLSPGDLTVSTVAEEGCLATSNYMNVPYSKPFADIGKRVVLDPGTDFTVPLRLDAFLDAAEASVNRPEAIAQAASLYVPPPPRAAVDIAEYDGSIDDVVAKLGGLAYTIFTQGPTERFGYKRFRTLQRLAYLCKDSGLLPSEAFAVVWDADGRYGKFHDRPDGELRVREIIERAYG